MNHDSIMCCPKQFTSLLGYFYAGTKKKTSLTLLKKKKTSLTLLNPKMSIETIKSVSSEMR